MADEENEHGRSRDKKKKQEARRGRAEGERRRRKKKKKKQSFHAKWRFRPSGIALNLRIGTRCRKRERERTRERKERKGIRDVFAAGTVDKCTSIPSYCIPSNYPPRSSNQRDKTLARERDSRGEEERRRKSVDGNARVELFYSIMQYLYVRARLVARDQRDQQPEKKTIALVGGHKVESSGGWKRN